MAESDHNHGHPNFFNHLLIYFHKINGVFGYIIFHAQVMRAPALDVQHVVSLHNYLRVDIWTLEQVTGKQLVLTIVTMVTSYLIL